MASALQLLAAALCVLAPCLAASTEALPLLSMEREDVDWLRAHGESDPRTEFPYAKLFREAEKALDRPDLSVVEKTQTPASGDHRDYLSLSRYWWPDDSEPDGLPWVRRDGKTNPKSKDDSSDAERLRDFARWVEILSLAYAISEDERYAERCVGMLETWFLDEDRGMRPNFRYSGSVPGVADGRASGLIEIRSLDRVLGIVALLEGSDSLSEPIRDGLRDWADAFLDWMLVSPIAREESMAENNHGTFFDAHIMTFALFVGRDDLARLIAAESIPARQERQFDDFGKQPEELDRSLSLHYSLFNLEAHFLCAFLAQNLGIDLWCDDYDRAITFVEKPILGEKPWMGEQIKELDPRAVGRFLRLLDRMGNRADVSAMTDALAGDEEYEESLDHLFLPLR